jgi:serine/threonine protein kinase
VIFIRKFEISVNLDSKESLISYDFLDREQDCSTITTTDLVCWAFQVACGMSYLVSRKILHGDLACRNILLCDGNVAKICDFGLSRTLHKSDIYKKENQVS